MEIMDLLEICRGGMSLVVCHEKPKEIIYRRSKICPRSMTTANVVL